ncbi:GNAT family N-acetyltransferase [Fibrella sp. Tmos10]
MIDTPRLWLVPVTESSLTELMADQPIRLADRPLTIPPEWAGLWVDHPGALAYTLNSLQTDPDLHTLGWGAYFSVHRADHALVGMGGFKGRPDETGTVEIGYSIVDPYRHQGLATETARGLVQFAFSRPDVRRVMAHTLAVENHSNRLLQSIGFHYNGLVHDPDDGDVWQWIIARTNN